jgi:glycosyltransferase involved in cell wall biosynthesis
MIVKSALRKIIFISNSIYPSQDANSVQVARMANAFSRNEFIVYLLAKSSYSDYDKNKFYKDFDVSAKVNLFFVKTLKSTFISLFSSFIIFPFFAVLNKNKYTLIYSRNIYSTTVLCFLGINHFYECHGISSNFICSLLEKYIYKSSRLNFIFVISERLKIDLTNKFDLEISNLIVLPDGADLHARSDLKKVKLNGDYIFNIGYTGSLYKGKGVELIFKASIQLKNIGFHIIGGSDEQILQIQKKYKNKNLFFYGHLNHSVVKNFINSFDAVTIPNMSKIYTGDGENIGKYTSPLKLFEYLSLNKTIISSRTAPILEILDECDAIFFEPGNLSDFIKKILISKSYKFSKGRALIKKKFSWNIRIKTIINLFNLIKK